MGLFDARRSAWHSCPERRVRPAARTSCLWLGCERRTDASDAVGRRIGGALRSRARGALPVNRGTEADAPAALRSGAHAEASPAAPRLHAPDTVRSERSL